MRSNPLNPKYMSLYCKSHTSSHTSYNTIISQTSQKIMIMFHVFPVSHSLFIGVDFGIFLRNWTSFKIRHRKRQWIETPFMPVRMTLQSQSLYGGRALHSVLCSFKSQSLYIMRFEKLNPSGNICISSRILISYNAYSDLITVIHFYSLINKEKIL